MAPHAPELLADFHEAVTQDDDTRIAALSGVFTFLPPADLNRIGPRLLAMVADNPRAGKRSDEFWVRLADLGPAARPALKAGLNVASPRAAAALGVCKLGPSGATLTADLNRLLSLRNDPSYQINPQQAASLALLRLGRRDLVQAYLARYYPTVPPWYAQRLDSITPASAASVCDVPKER